MKRKNKVLFRSDDVSTARCLTSPRSGRSRRVEYSRPSTSVLHPNEWSTSGGILNAVLEPLKLSRRWVRWLLQEAGERGIVLLGAEEEDTGGWMTCSPSALLALTVAPDSQVWVSQRTGCAGYVTAVQFVDHRGRCGAWIVDRSFGESEPESWRILILEALVLSHTDGEVGESTDAL